MSSKEWNSQIATPGTGPGIFGQALREGGLRWFAQVPRAKSGNVA